jgi:hypothetical protein
MACLLRRGGAIGRPVFHVKTGLAGGAKSECAILRAMQAFQSVRLIFLQLRQRRIENYKNPKQRTNCDFDIVDNLHKATVDGN